MMLGAMLRSRLRTSVWSQRHFLPLVALTCLPYGVQWVENQLPRRTEVATVQTELRVDATAEEAFRAVQFYEQVEHDPPWLLHLALPRPIRSQGSKESVGNVVRCYYDRGYLVKRISERVENERLAFDVLEQQLGFEHDVKLQHGSFEIVPDDGAHRRRCRIVVTTTYERYPRPTWIWQPFEELVVHTLHEHVLEGMRRSINARRGDEPPARYPLPATPRTERLATLQPGDGR